MGKYGYSGYRYIGDSWRDLWKKLSQDYLNRNQDKRSYTETPGVYTL